MRKLRTRRHVLEELSHNFVEKQILLANFVFRGYSERQYSYDGIIETFSENGEFENGIIYVQVKATEKFKYSNKHDGYILNLEKRDLDLWLKEIYPVIVVFYEANSDSGNFVNLHKYFRENKVVLKEIHKYKRIYIPPKNLFTNKSVFDLRITKNILHENYQRIQGYGTHLW